MKIFLKSIFLVVLFVLIVFPVFASAQALGPTTNPAVGSNSLFQLKNPLSAENFCDLIKTILNILMVIGIPVAVLFLMWSGFRFVLARGNSTELQNARRNFYYVIIGIVVFLGAWTIATVIAGTLKELSKNSSNPINICT